MTHVNGCDGVLQLDGKTIGYVTGLSLACIVSWRIC